MKSQIEYPIVMKGVAVPCRFGMSLLVASRVVRMARRYQSKIYLRSGKLKADAKSVLSIILMEAGRGAQMVLSGQGEDADRAVKAISVLFKSEEVLCGKN